MSWWEDTLGNIGDFAKQRGEDILGMLFSTTALGRAGGGPVAEAGRQVFGRPGDEPLPNIADLPGFTDITSQQPQYQQPVQQMPVSTVPTMDEFMANVLGQVGGGGGVDLSGYNSMLEDIAAREAALGGRRDENLAGIQSLYESAAAAREEDIAALQASIEAQVQGDMERQASQEANRREAEDQRFQTASDARAALGADVGTSDLVGQTVEQSLGRLAERALSGQQNVQNLGQIGQQRIQAEKSGYTSAQELATRALTNNYEDRLAQLASERAATQAQMAQARAAARPTGPSVSDILGIQSAYQAQYGEQPVEIPELPGISGIAQSYYPFHGEKVLDLGTKFSDYAASVGYGKGFKGDQYLDPGALTERIVQQYPELRDMSDVIFSMSQLYASG